MKVPVKIRSILEPLIFAYIIEPRAQTSFRNNLWQRSKLNNSFCITNSNKNQPQFVAEDDDFNADDNDSDMSLLTVLQALEAPPIPTRGHRKV